MLSKKYNITLTDKEIENEIVKSSAKKLNDRIKNKKQCESMNVIVIVMEEVEKYKIEGNRKKEIVKRVIEVLILGSTLFLPPNIKNDLHEFLKSDKIDNIMSIIVLASKGVLKLNIHTRLYNMGKKCIPCC